MKVFIVHPDNPNKRDISQIVDLLNNGGIGIIPTDSVYAIATLMSNKDGIDRICKVTNKTEKKAKLSLLCKDLKAVADHTLPYDNHIFKSMKHYLPGPYTFILNANNSVTKYFKNNKKEIGIRIPDNNIVLELLAAIEGPLISTSLQSTDEFDGASIDIETIQEQFANSVEFLIDGSMTEAFETTVLDCTSGEIQLVRQGKGEIS
jgi:tRNA threonylcarbamoyl adenosine modification protein (Sua5/YciO/YrdC/YwlC family)